MSFYGADVGQLRDLAVAFDGAASRLDGGRAAVSNRIQLRLWMGPIAARFRLNWDSQYSRMLHAAAEDLRRAATVLRDNATEQERTSSGGDSPTPSPDPGLTEDLGNYESAGQISLDDSELDANQIYQGQLGDCWFLASLGAVVERNPEFIRSHMHQNADGTWTVTMYRNGEPVEITVEPTVAENGVGGPNGEPNWASIYEKAAAVFFGGDYEDIDSDYPDRALAAITGASTQRSGELSLAEIQDRLAEGPVVLASEQLDKGETPWWPFDHEIDNNQIVPGHAYMVDDVREIDGELMIHVVNPWGPDGGGYNGVDRVGDIWLTEQEYRENFDAVYTADWNG